MTSGGKRLVPSGCCKYLVEMRGIEPLTSALRTQDSGVIIH